MLLSVEVSSSCCAAAWLSHAGSPCPSSSLICALLPLDQSHQFIFFPHLPSCQGLVSLSFANQAVLCPAFSHLLHRSPFEANCGSFLPVPCWHVSVVPMDILTFLPMRLAVGFWQKQSLSSIGYSLDEHQLLFSTGFAWRPLELEKILRRQPEARPEMGVHVGTRYKTSVLVLPVWRGQSENACPEVWWRFTLMGMKAWQTWCSPCSSHLVTAAAARVRSLHCLSDLYVFWNLFITTRQPKNQAEHGFVFCFHLVLFFGKLPIWQIGVGWTS